MTPPIAPKKSLRDTIVDHREPIARLLRGDATHAVIQGFASAAFCDTVLARVKAHNFSAYPGVFPVITKIGPTAYEYTDETKAAYFQAATEGRMVLNALFAGLDDPAIGIMRLFSGFDRRFAVDPQHGGYAQGIMRSIVDGTPVHIDFAPHESPTFAEISRVKRQFVANLYIAATPDAQTTIFEKRWSPADEAFKLKDSFGYSDFVVANAARAVYQPTVGDVLIIDTQHYHRVKKTPNERLTFSLTFGLLDDDTMLFWS